MVRRVDFDSPIPFYIQLETILREQISQKILVPGDRLPSEHEICATYGVSRTVVRHALQDLETDGLIYRRKGRGSFVAEPKIVEGLAQKLTGFYHDMVDRGLTPVTRVLRQEVLPARKTVADRLEIEEGASIIELERIRSVEGEPIVLVTSYLPASLCPGLDSIDLSNRSLYDTIEEQFDLQIVRGRRFMEAVLADQREAELLDVEHGAPLLMLNSVSYLEDDTPVEFFHAVHRGDRSRFEVELVRVREIGNRGKLPPSSLIDLPPSNS